MINFFLTPPSFDFCITLLNLKNFVKFQFSSIKVDNSEMFKKLKDKIAEEVKQSPARFQEIINSAQVMRKTEKLKSEKQKI